METISYRNTKHVDILYIYFLSIYVQSIVVTMVKKSVDIECKAGRDKCNLKVINNNKVALDIA